MEEEFWQIEDKQSIQKLIHQQTVQALQTFQPQSTLNSSSIIMDQQFTTSHIFKPQQISGPQQMVQALQKMEPIAQTQNINQVQEVAHHQEKSEPQEMIKTLEAAHPQKLVKHEITIPGGLPNIGNTCYLNSALQQFYQIDVVNNFISSYEAETQDLATVLRQLFQTMRCQGQFERLRRILSKVTKYMSRLLSDYVPRQQRDSFEAFLNILDYLFNLSPRLKDSFQVKFSHKCSCNGMVIEFQEVTIQGQGTMRCFGCQEHIKRYFTSLPEYLIVRHSQDKKPSSTFEELDNPDYCYQIQSKNMYSGNGNSGHYYAECQYQGQQYIFNDSYRSKKSLRTYSDCLFAIYKKTNKPSTPPSSGQDPQYQPQKDGLKTENRFSLYKMYNQIRDRLTSKDSMEIISRFYHKAKFEQGQELLNNKKVKQDVPQQGEINPGLQAISQLQIPGSKNLIPIQNSQTLLNKSSYHNLLNFPNQSFSWQSLIHNPLNYINNISYSPSSLFKDFSLSGFFNKKDHIIERDNQDEKQKKKMSICEFNQSQNSCNQPDWFL